MTSLGEIPFRRAHSGPILATQYQKGFSGPMLFPMRVERLLCQSAELSYALTIACTPLLVISHFSEGKGNKAFLTSAFIMVTIVEVQQPQPNSPERHLGTKKCHHSADLE